MNHFSISNQVHLAVGCALLLLALLAGLSYLATSKLSYIFDDYKEKANQTLIANELLNDVADVQLAAAAYRLSPSDRQASEVLGLIDAIVKRQRVTKQTLLLDEEAREKLWQVSKISDGYRKAFEETTELTAESERIAAYLRPVASQIRANLDDIMRFASDNGHTALAYNAAIAQQKFMRSRFRYKSFVLTNDSNTFEAALAFMIAVRVRIKSFLPTLNDPRFRDLANATISLISAYDEQARANHDLIQQRKSLQEDTLERLGQDLRIALADLLHGAVDHQKAMGQSGADGAATTLNLVVFIAIAAPLIGGGLGIIIARQISGSVRRMANSMSELADGNLDIAIVGTDQKHELGMMARALAVFKSHAENLQRSLDKERELNGLQRQFVSMVSHEFRTPLAIIDGSAQRLERRPERITTERVLPITKKIRTSVLRLTNLMESVLSAARLEEGRIALEPKTFDLGAMIVEICQGYMEINANHKIEVDIDGLPRSCHGDPRLLRQVVSNLVSNALKYSPESTRVAVRGGLAPDGRITFLVEDEGVGIPADELERLFERFFRASTSTGIPGSGIGLHLVKHLVELHQGTMHVRSEVGSGTTFEVYLPAKEMTPLPDQQTEDIGSPRQSLDTAAA
jgi:signal transduction histidine kinase